METTRPFRHLFLDSGLTVCHKKRSKVAPFLGGVTSARQHPALGAYIPWTVGLNYGLGFRDPIEILPARVSYIDVNNTQTMNCLTSTWDVGQKGKC